MNGRKKYIYIYIQINKQRGLDYKVPEYTVQSGESLRDVFEFRYFFLGYPTNRRGLCLLSDQSPATVVQGITHSQLLGYTYQATTFDPAPPHPTNTASHYPGKLTPAVLRASLANSDISTQIPQWFCRLRARLLRHASHQGPGSSKHAALNTFWKPEMVDSVPIHQKHKDVTTKITQIFDFKEVKHC